METGGNILVVDDNNVFRMVVSKMLSRLGYEVSSADSGENGLNLFLKNKFDVVLSDYEMPGMDGVAFACSIKKTSPRTPVVIMTGAGRETVFSRKSTSVDEVISKPFTLAQIDKTIQNVSCTTQCAHSLIELDRKLATARFVMPGWGCEGAAEWNTRLQLL